MSQLQKKSRRNSSRKNLRKSKRQSKKVSNKSNKRQNNRKNLGRKNKTSGGSRKNTKKQLRKKAGGDGNIEYKCTCVLETGTTSVPPAPAGPPGTVKPPAVPPGTGKPTGPDPGYGPQVQAEMLIRNYAMKTQPKKTLEDFKKEIMDKYHITEEEFDKHYKKYKK